MDMSFLTDQYPLVLGENHPILRSEAGDIVFPLSADLKKLYVVLPNLMWEYDGVGLAAPQVGQSVKMMATTQWKVKGGDYKHLWDTVMINPKIIEESEETIIIEEGCLSLPWQMGDVERSRKVTVEYYNDNWKKHTETYEGFNAVVVQHEIDHLHWILFVDKTID